jgi:hypothetical protein
MPSDGCHLTGEAPNLGMTGDAGLEDGSCCWAASADDGVLPINRREQVPNLGWARSCLEGSIPLTVEVVLTVRGTKNDRRRVDEAIVDTKPKKNNKAIDGCCCCSSYEHLPVFYNLPTTLSVQSLVVQGHMYVRLFTRDR